MKTLCQIHVEKARQYNRTIVRYKIFGWPLEVERVRQIRDDHMRRARNAQGGKV